MDNKLIEKIQKLLSLSESSNQHEAKVALLKAQELLVKHKLSMQDVKNLKVYNSNIKDNPTNISFTKAKWKGELADLIAENFGCYIYYMTRRINTIVFFGREEDVLVCNIVLEYAVDCIEEAIKRIQRGNTKNGFSNKGVSTDYAIGFIVGLRDKFQEQKRENQEWGLVLVRDKEVVQAYSEKKFTRSLNTSSEFQGNGDMYHKGKKDGGKFSISDKISQADEVFELEC